MHSNTFFLLNYSSLCSTYIGRVTKLQPSLPTYACLQSSLSINAHFQSSLPPMPASCLYLPPAVPTNHYPRLTVHIYLCLSPVFPTYPCPLPIIPTYLPMPASCLYLPPAVPTNLYSPLAVPIYLCLPPVIPTYLCSPRDIPFLSLAPIWSLSTWKSSLGFAGSDQDDRI